MHKYFSICRFLAAGAVALAISSPAAAADPIKMGAVLTVTGNAGIMGDPQDKTLRLYVDKINAAGGVLGRKIELTIYDDGSNAEKANSFGKRLIEQDQVDIIIGVSSTGSTMAIVPLAERAKVSLLSYAGASVVVEPVKPYVFKIPHSDRMAVRKALEDMKRSGIAKLGVISDTGGFGKSARAETLAAAKTYGVDVVSDQSYGDKDTDMTPQLTKVKGSDAQAVLVLGVGAAPAIIAKNYQQLGMKIPLYMSHAQSTMDFVHLAGKAAEGVRMPAPALLIAQDLPNSDPQKAVGIAYQKEYAAAYKTEASPFGGYIHDGLLMAVDAIKRAGGTDKEKLRTALENTKNFVGVIGIFNMSASDHLGLDLTALHMVEVSGGKFKELK